MPQHGSRSTQIKPPMNPAMGHLRKWYKFTGLKRGNRNDLQIRWCSHHIYPGSSNLQAEGFTNQSSWKSGCDVEEAEAREKSSSLLNPTLTFNVCTGRSKLNASRSAPLNITVAIPLILSPENCYSLPIFPLFRKNPCDRCANMNNNDV